jgi:hypothetical protein
MPARAALPSLDREFDSILWKLRRPSVDPVNVVPYKSKRPPVGGFFQKTAES